MISVTREKIWDLVGFFFVFFIVIIVLVVVKSILIMCCVYLFVRPCFYLPGIYLLASAVSCQVQEGLSAINVFSYMPTFPPLLPFHSLQKLALSSDPRMHSARSQTLIRPAMKVSSTTIYKVNKQNRRHHWHKLQ